MRIFYIKSKCCFCCHYFALHCGFYLFNVITSRSLLSQKLFSIQDWLIKMKNVQKWLQKSKKKNINEMFTIIYEVSNSSSIVKGLVLFLASKKTIFVVLVLQQISCWLLQRLVCHHIVSILDWTAHWARGLFFLTFCCRLTLSEQIF